MRASTRSGCGSPSCRSMPKRSTARSAPSRTSLSRMSDMTARTISFTLNGGPVSAEVASHHTILEVLRNDFALYGARESCAQGLCGCCTVLVDGTAVSGCLYLAAFVDGAKVVTLEHQAGDGKLSVIQEAFLESGATQCGFCTPGFVLMAGQLLEAHPVPDDDTIRHYL